MDLQDPKVQRILLASVLSAVLAYVFFGTSMLPISFQAKKAEIAQLSEEHERLTRELERARLTVGNMAKVEREFEYLHRQWKVAQSLLPEANEMSGLLRKVTAAGTQAGLEFVEFTPQPTLGRGFFSECPVNVKIEGGFHQVGSFLGSMSNMGRILNVRNLRLIGVQPEAQAKPEINHTLEATMQVVAYSIDPSGLAPDMSASGQNLAQSGQGQSGLRGVRDKLNAARQASTGGEH